MQFSNLKIRTYLITNSTQYVMKINLVFVIKVVLNKKFEHFQNRKEENMKYVTYIFYWLFEDITIYETA